MTERPKLGGQDARQGIPTEILWNNYLLQEKYIIVVVCLCVCLLAILPKNFRTDLHEIFRESWQWASKQMIN